MDESSKENIHFQPCSNPLERRIFRTKRRKPEGEPEVNTRLFEEIYNELDNLRSQLAFKEEEFEETYSGVILENIKGYLSEILTSRDSVTIETTVSFVAPNNKTTCFKKDNLKGLEAEPLKKKQRKETDPK